MDVGPARALQAADAGGHASLVRTATYLSNSTIEPHLARRNLVLEPWDEEAHRQLIQALAFSGQRSLALAQYEGCARILRQDLGTGPSPETVALGESIREGTLQPVAGPDKAQGCRSNANRLLQVRHHSRDWPSSMRPMQICSSAGRS